MPAAVLPTGVALAPGNERSHWRLVDQPPALRGGEVHIWWVCLPGTLDELGPYRDLLTEDERRRCERFVFDADRIRYSATRAALRSLLAEYLCTPTGKLRIEMSARGKPLLHGAEPQLKFNLSHSGSAALIGVALDREIGVDVEQWRPLSDLDSLAGRVLSNAEADAFDAMPTARRPSSFLQCWTRKEALVKAMGEGLHYPLDQVDVGFGPSPRTLRGLGSRWTVEDLGCDSHSVAAAAYAGEVAVMSLFRWERFRSVSAPGVRRGGADSVG